MPRQRVAPQSDASGVRRCSFWWLAGLLLALVVGAFPLGSVLAQDSDAVGFKEDATKGTALSDYDVRVDQFSADFTGSYAIEVPAFRGLEPSLALNYRSSSGNGLLGVGWALQGDARIERVGKRRGAPRWDSSDIYLLDGMELVPCTAQVSPSCSHGGTHSTKIESYRKVKFNGETAGWSVWAKNGTRTDYTGRFNVANGKAWHWLRNQTVDTHGNTVLYSYIDTGTWSYPNQISYNGITITFRYEMRPDPIRLANGTNVMSLLDRRLITVAVDVSGQRLRGYQLQYGTPSTASKRSRLISARQYGRNVSYNTAGAVIGGDALPATTMAYSDHAQGGFGWTITAGDNWVSGNWRSRTGTGDFNGDGLTDLFVYQRTLELINGFGASRSNNVYLSNGNGTFTRVDSGTTSSEKDDLNAHNWACLFDANGVCQDVLGRRLSVSFADFNGDGKTDYAVRVKGKTWLLVGISNGNGTFARSFYYSQIAGSNGWFGEANTETMVGDFNGDGCADIALRRTNGVWTNTPLFLANCQGSFTASFPSNALSTFTHQTGVKAMVADFNGDGMADIALRKVGWGSIPVMLADGAGNFRTANVTLPAGTNWINEDMTTRLTMVGDFNGDGKADIALRSPTSAWTTLPVYLSNGDGSFTVLNRSLGGNNLVHGGGIDGNGVAKRRELLGDFNGDGRMDIALQDTTGTMGWTGIPVYYADSDGGFTFAHVASTNNSLHGTSQDTGVVGDFGGDGRSDIHVRTASGFQEVRIASPAATQADLLTTRSNGYGGVTTASYRPSSGWVNSNNPPLRQTLSQLTVKDGRAAASDRTDVFSYSGGLWDRIDRRFLGFRTAARITCNSGESNCQTEQTWFKQDYGSVSKPEEVRLSAGANILLKLQRYTYAANGATVPYTSLLSSQVTYDYDGSGVSTCPGASCKQRQINFTYDTFGNTTGVFDTGDLAVTGDELNRRTAFVPNNAAYIVGLPAVETVYTGLGSSGPVQQTQFPYDQPNAASPTWNKAPTKGDRTQIMRWLNTNGSMTKRSFTFDAKGNVLTESDEVGNVWRKTYDATYQLYPITSTDPLNRSTTTAWDTVCGKPATLTGLNGSSDKSTFTYDNLCRETRMDTPLGGFKITKYQSFGSANSQNVRVETPSADGLGNQWTETWFDGLGRTWRERGKGPGGQVITSNFEFNRRGKPSRVSQPYYAGTPRYETFSYDALDRLLQIQRPDGRIVRNVYGAWKTSTYNERGDLKELLVDARGNVTTERFRTCGSCGWLQNTHKYDLLNRRIESNDADGNRWTYSYNSLDQLLSERDPDRGTWTFTYFADGKVATQRDAKGQTTTYSYDALRRQRTANVGTITRTWTYDQARTGFFNIGRLSSITDQSGGASYDFDLAGRQTKMVKTISGTSYTFSNGYDAGGRLKWTTYPNGSTVGTATAPLTYDGAGRAYQIPGVVTGASYTAGGALATLNYANGTSSTYSHDSADRLSTLKTDKGTTSLLNLSYGRDPTGAITSIGGQRPFESWTYAYDGLSRLTTATPLGSTTESFTYSSSGRMTFSSRFGTGSAGTYTYPAQGATSVRPHAPTKIGSAITYAYDANGNRLSGSGGTHTWDAANRLIQLGNTTFAYDADDQRVRKNSTHYPRGDYRVSAGVVTQHIRLGKLTVASRTGSVLSWLHSDHQGSPLVVTNSTGAEIQRFARRPYGQRAVVATAVEEELDFTGARRDAETGLGYFGPRYYDSNAQLFIAPDRLDVTRPSVGFARYAYSVNNPVNYIDNGNEAYDYLSTNLNFLLARAAFGQMTGEPPVVIAAAGILNTTDGFPSFLNQFKSDVNSYNPAGLTIVIPNGGPAIGQVINALGTSAHPQQVANVLALTNALANQGINFQLLGFSNGNAAIGAAASQFSQQVLDHLTGITMVSANISRQGALDIFGLGKETNFIRNPSDPALRGAGFGHGDQLTALGLMNELGTTRYPNVKVFFPDSGTHGFGPNFGISGASLFGIGAFAPSVDPVFNVSQFGTFDRFGSGGRFDFGLGASFDTTGFR